MSTGTTPPHRSEDWAWLDNDLETPTADDAAATPPDGSSVAAVLVVHDAEAWLSDTVASIAALRPAPVAVIAVDVGSSDRSRELLQQAVSAGALTSVLTSSVTDSLADAFAVGIAEVEKNLEAQWFWFLHDDVQPRTDALGELLTATERQPEVAVWVPILLEPRRRNHPTLIQSLGKSVSPTGRRIESSAVGDIDQGQNEPQRVLGGSSAGLMVRADSYHHLGGFLPLAGWHRAGVDLGWRATCAGQVVSTCPTARLHHMQAGLTGLRHGIGDTDPRLDDRLAGVRLVAARTTRRGQLAMFLALMGSALLLLIGKAATRARHELLAGWSLLSDRARIAQLREQSSRTNAEPPNNRCRELRPGWGRSLAAQLDGWVTSTPSRSTGRDDGASLDELTGDDFAASGGGHSTRSRPFLVGCARGSGDVVGGGAGAVGCRLRAGCRTAPGAADLGGCLGCLAASATGTGRRQRAVAGSGRSGIDGVPRPAGVVGARSPRPRRARGLPQRAPCAGRHLLRRATS